MDGQNVGRVSPRYFREPPRHFNCNDSQQVRATVSATAFRFDAACRKACKTARDIARDVDLTLQVRDAVGPPPRASSEPLRGLQNRAPSGLGKIGEDEVLCPPTKPPRPCAGSEPMVGSAHGSR